MLPATPEELAALGGRLRPATPPSFSLALDAAEVHANTAAGKYSNEAFGRYCRTGLPMLLRRLLAAETERLILRTKVAGHIAAADQGYDPAPGELLEDLRRAGIDLTAEAAEAGAVLEAQAHDAAF
jgi:hypothetical protein